MTWQGIEPRCHSYDVSGTKRRTVSVRSGTPLGAPTYTYTDFIEPYDSGSSCGYNLPQFTKRKRKGELLPITPWEQHEIYGSQQAAYKIEYKPSGTVTYVQETAWTPIGGIQSLVPTLASIELKLYDTDQYVQAAAARIYSQGWDALTFVAELNQAVRMFQSMGLRMASYGAEIVKKGLIEKPILELRYGWRTLVYDLIDLHKVLGKLDDHRQRFRESAKTNLTESETITSVWGLGGAGSATVTTQTSVKIGLRGTVVADIEPPKFAFNPIVTGYELIPYSFVLDWFINVGRWLNTLSFIALQSQHYAAAGWHIEMEYSHSVTKTTANSGWAVTCTGSGNARRCLTKRTPTTIPLVPLVSVNLNVAKVLDVLALVLTRVIPGTRTKLLRQILAGSAMIPSSTWGLTNLN